MTTREEIEAAVEAWRRYRAGEWLVNIFGSETPNHNMWLTLNTLADAFLSERAERQRRIEAAAKQIEDNTITLLLGNGVDLRKHRIAIANDIRDIITRCLDGETT